MARAGVVLCCVWTSFAGAEESMATLVLDKASFKGSTAQSPEFVGGDGFAVELPDVWSLERRAAHQWGWYRVPFHLKERPTMPLALYVPRASRNAAFYVNGHFVGSGGPIEDSHYRNWNRSHFFTLPPTLLQSGENVMDVRLATSDIGKDGLSRLYIGEDKAIRPLYDLRRFHQQTFPWIQNGINAFLIVFLTLLWWLRRERPELIFFALALASWTVRNLLYMQWHAPPMSDWMLDLLQMQLFNGVFAFLAFFCVRFVGARSRWIDATALTLLILPLALELLLPEDSKSWLRLFTYLFANLMGLGVTVLLGFHAWKSRRAENILLFASAMAMVLIGARDLLVVQNKLGFEETYLLQYAALPLFLAMGWALLKRLLDSMVAAEDMTRDLESRVADKHSELEFNYARLNQIERVAAVAEERGRVMQDMHDGMGSQLMTTLALVENRQLSQAEVAEALRGCIDDMRLTIDSMQPEDNDLASLLGNLRYRLEPRLLAAGIELEWRVTDLPVLDNAGPHAQLQVLRIVQEAFTNVLKHSGANRVRVETSNENGAARLVVADNGRGRDASAPVPDRGGRGLNNMQSRARSLGADLNFSNTGDGHIVELRFAIRTS